MFHLSRIVQLTSESFGVTIPKTQFLNPRIRCQNDMIRSHDLALIMKSTQRDSAATLECSAHCSRC
jgi:hypothetical protein